MSDVVIRVENLGKRYRIGERERYVALRDVLTRAATAPARLFKPRPATPNGDNSHIWALKDVSFDIRQGEVVGIIGRNGAGKSTLLKILARVTKPTKGSAEVRGRMGTLLEVGTGFHPELTGRENVFLSGAILGMGKSEIRRKFDEILDFAEVEKFIDTPLKHYSSGMQMRLAFAVAAHLEPEILLVDEVLAVGDSQFQKKCLGKMEQVARQGHTVLFVSHNANAVERLCQRVILLDDGYLAVDSSDVRATLSYYLSHGESGEDDSVWVNNGGQFKDSYFTPLRMAIVDGEGNELSMPIRNDADMWVEIEGEIATPDPALTVGYGLFDESGLLLYWSCQTDQPEANWPLLGIGKIGLRGKIQSRLLNEGNYRLGLLASLHYRGWVLQPGSHAPHVSLKIRGGLSESPYWMTKRPGILAPVISWSELELAHCHDTPPEASTCDSENVCNSAATNA